MRRARSAVVLSKYQLLVGGGRRMGHIRKRQRGREVLTIRNSHVEATARKGSICDIANLVLEGCSITQPNGAEFDAKNHAVALNGKKVTDKVVIEPDSYDVQIAGVDVTSLNCKDLSVIDGVDGKMKLQSRD